MGKTKIEWTEHRWNPVRGCTRVSRGCGGPGPHGGCYAEAIAARFSGPGLSYEGLAEMRDGKPRWTGKLAFSETALLEPLRRRKPTTYFVNSMSDLFHEKMPEAWIDKVFAVMALCPQHVFQVLTKRPARMRAYLSEVSATWCDHSATRPGSDRIYEASLNIAGVDWLPETPGSWPLSNVWAGVSAEDQETADARIPDLLATPAAVRFCSAEPLLGPIDFTCLRGPPIDYPEAPRRAHWIDALTGEHGTFLADSRIVRRDRMPRIDQVIIGGESGPNARPFDIDWARSIIAQGEAAGVAVFLKQLGANPYSDGRPMHGAPRGKHNDPALWPPEIRVRQMPEARHV